MEPPARLTGDEALAEEAVRIEGLAPDHATALCLSGGGIRSAAFCLGVLQALARQRVLGRFHYLSTVSGGGYIGAWLTARIGARGGAGIAEAEEALRGEAPDAEWLLAMRRSGNFLTPEIGAFSADTWAVITLYVRNLLLTWFSFLPPVLVLVLALVFYRTALAVTGGMGWLAALLLLGGCVCLGVSTECACRALPSHVGTTKRFVPTAQVQRVVWLAMGWPLLAPAGVAVGLGADQPALAGTPFGAAALLGGAYFATMTAAYLWAWGATHAAWRRGRGDPLVGVSLRLFRRNAIAWLIATMAATALTGGGIWVLNDVAPPSDQVALLAVFAPVGLTLAMVVHTGTHIGFRREARFAELDREWTARFSALVLRAGGVIGIVAFCVLGLAHLAVPGGNGDWRSPVWAALLSPLISGPVVAWLGTQGLSRLPELRDLQPTWRDRAVGVLLGVLAFVFAAGLLAALAAVMQSWVLGPVQGWLMDLLLGGRDRPIPVWLMLGLQLALIAGLIVVAWQMSVDNNRFSLHGMYRNRLVRAFVGAARPRRMPDPLTGFDPEDDPRLADLIPKDAPRRLFPVLNMAVNLTRSTTPQSAERRALSFAATPLHCGFFLPGQAGAPPRTYVATRDYAGRGSGGMQQGLRLGAAMTISGASASPNAGYNSAAATAFLMTLFNVRLGAWLPNPSEAAGLRDLSHITPLDQRLAIAGDLLGQTRITGRAIYLSDGGHFDNLGLYEMLRRRCTAIVVVDAGHDPACSFTDLGNAVRKAAVDLGVVVDIEAPRIASRGGRQGTGGPPLQGFAVGTITYPAAEGRPRTGRLLYLKPTWLDDLPMDVRAYGSAEPAFPHQSTGDQWFSESQFESYRSLGEHQMRRVAGAAPPGTVAALLDAASAALLPPRPAA